MASFLTPASNISSMVAQSKLSLTQRSLSKSTERLSSGFKINRAADDAAGMGVVQTMSAASRGIKQASVNANDGVSLLQTAEGGLAVIQEALQRMRELAVQSSNGTYTTADRALIDSEFQQKINEITRISADNTFNSLGLLSAATIFTFHVGPSTSTTNDQISYTGADSSASGLTVNALAVTSAASALAAMTSVDTAISTISSRRSVIGAVQNRLESTIDNLANMNNNIDASISRKQDTDFAAEMSALTKGQILHQAGLAVLSQANSLQSSILTLLKG